MADAKEFWADRKIILAESETCQACKHEIKMGNEAWRQRLPAAWVGDEPVYVDIYFHEKCYKSNYHHRNR